MLHLIMVATANGDLGTCQTPSQTIHTPLLNLGKIVHGGSRSHHPVSQAGTRGPQRHWRGPVGGRPGHCVLSSALCHLPRFWGLRLVRPDPLRLETSARSPKCAWGLHPRCGSSFAPGLCPGRLLWVCVLGRQFQTMS